MTQTTDVRHDLIDTGRLWFVFLSGPIVWAIHFTLVYIFAEFGCATRFSTMMFAGQNGIVIAVIITTVIALALTVIATIMAYQRRDPENLEDNILSLEFQHFMAESGWIMNAIFSVVIIVTAIHALWVSSCAHFGITG